MSRFLARLWFPLLLAVLTVVLYLPALAGQYLNYDDHVYVSQNSHVRSGLTTQNIVWAWTTCHGANWHPLTWLSLQLDVTALGPQAWTFHLTNVVFHAANAALLFLALRALTGASVASGFVAALFAFHPLHVESVAWISERKDVLSTFFGLAALWAYAGYARRPSLLRGGLVGLLFVLSLLAKPMFVTLPFLLLLLDWWPLGRVRGGPVAAAEPSPTRSASALVVEKTPLFVLSAFSCLVTWAAQTVGGAVQPLENSPLSSRFANAANSYVIYLFEACYPVDLAAFHPLATSTFVSNSQSAVADPRWIASAFFLLAVSGVAVWQIRRRPYLAVGWFWYLGTLVPVIGIAQVGDQAHADRYTYFPLIGACIALVWWLIDVVPLRTRKPLTACATLMLLWFAFLTFLQIGYWHDSVILWSRDLEVVGPNALALGNLGTALLVEQGDIQKAVELASEALAIKPTDYVANITLGVVRRRQRRYEEALRFFETAQRERPNDAKSYYNVGLVKLLLGDPAGAAAVLEEGRVADPSSYSLCYLHALSLLRLKRQAEAKAEFEAAFAREPNWPQIVFQEAWRMATSDHPGYQEGPVALIYGEVIYDASDGREPHSLDLLAAAYAQIGQFPEAIDFATQALSVARKIGDKSTVDEIEKRLQLYRQGQPYRRHYSH